MPDLYLIAHKVRGEPAFDVAERCEIAGEEAWIIPTSGHRAYPYWYISLNSVAGNATGMQLLRYVPEMPSDLRDHYEITRETRTTPQAGQKIAELDLADLGL